MKIVVLGGGISTERHVSLVSGTSVCRALRSLGHKAIFVDMFLGQEDYEGSLEAAFDAPDGFCGSVAIEKEAPDLEAVKASRKLKSPSRLGKNVLEVCALADCVFLGLHGGAIGETCCLALLLGFAWLLFRRVISWHVPVIFVGTVFVLYLVFTGSFQLALAESLAGGLFIGAIFMATDYVTSPITRKGKMVFALGCGLVTFIIRYFCAYPEGVSFSILAMNILTPYIEKFTANTPLGGSKNG